MSRVDRISFFTNSSLSQSYLLLCPQSSPLETNQQVMAIQAYVGEAPGVSKVVFAILAIAPVVFSMRPDTSLRRIEFAKKYQAVFEFTG